jgi:Na+-translocating ferredoxin:NAD+ oxidoreductase RnfC subunit
MFREFSTKISAACKPYQKVNDIFMAQHNIRLFSQIMLLAHILSLAKRKLGVMAQERRVTQEPESL